MDDLLNPLLAVLKSVNPLAYVVAVVVFALWGDKLKALLGGLKLPRLPKADPKEPDPKTDPDKWLEDHPLADRLWKLLKEKFKDKVLTGDVTEDDLYVALVKSIKSTEVK